MAIFFIAACTNSDPVQKPPLTIEEFDKESLAIKGVLMKFIQDNDPTQIHEASLAVESTFAVSCTPVGQECKEFHDIVTKIIQVTQDRKFSLEEKTEVLKMYYPNHQK